MPWERRRELGTWQALVETVRRSLLEPRSFFRDMPPEGPTPSPTYGPIGSALLYAVIIAIPSIIIGLFWQSMASWFRLLTGGGDEAMLSLGRMILLALFTPVLLPILLIISAAVIHLILMILGGARYSLTATFRVLCYAAAPDLFEILPVCGALISVIWRTALIIVGVKEVHRTSWPVAVTAVLLPVFLCCWLPIMTLIVIGIAAGNR